MADNTTNGNGLSGYGPKRLVQLLEHHQSRADALRLTLAMLHESERTSKKATVSQHVAAALGMEKARVARRIGRPPGSKTKKGRHPYKGIEHAKSLRRATATFLKAFSIDTPKRTTNPHRIGVLVQHGYLKAAGEGLYLRTNKEFTA